MCSRNIYVVIDRGPTMCRCARSKIAVRAVVVCTFVPVDTAMATSSTLSASAVSYLLPVCVVRVVFSGPKAPGAEDLDRKLSQTPPGHNVRRCFFLDTAAAPLHPEFLAVCQQNFAHASKHARLESRL